MAHQYKIFPLVFSLTLFCLSPFGVAEGLDVKAMTFNLRVPIDPPPNDWASRKPRIFKVINQQQPDFLGVQEALPDMVADIGNSVDGYTHVGRGRDADSLGEGAQIFYRSSRWHIDPIDYGTIQLSPTPDVPGSNGWHMSLPRIFTWARFTQKTSGLSLYVFNTHFPLVAQERYLSAQLLAKYIAQRKHTGEPVILLGDFNAHADEESMQYLMGANASPVAFVDSFRALYPTATTSTFQGFGADKDAGKIDYIYVLGDLQVVAAGVIVDAENAGFASDHYAVTAVLRFNDPRHKAAH